MIEAGRRYAILIGSSQFDKESLKPLQCPERDVDGMQELLAAAEFGQFDEVFVFKNAHHQAPLDQIEEVLATAARDDQVLIYYSGHGVTDLPGRLYLTTSNTDIRRPVTTSIPIETLKTMIENSDCRKIILIFDCCYGGAVGKSFVKGSAEEKLMELARGYGVYILTASTAAQTAQEREGDEYGLLTKHIIAGIKDGAAANDDGLVTMDGLYAYVYRQVISEGHQEPMRWALNVKGEDLIIARAAGLYSTQQLQAFKRLLNKLEDEEEIDEEICHQIRLVLRENQPKRDKRLFELLNQLHKGALRPGKFITLWLKESANQSVPSTTAFIIPPSVGQPAEVAKPAPKPAAEKRDPANKPVPPRTKPPEGGATNATANGFTDDLNGVKLEMVYIPRGEFTMGSEKYDSERPPHKMTVPAFYIGKFQVTQAQWKAVMGDKLKPSFKGDDLPMEKISWEDAKKFCQKLTQLTNKAYRLPSEAEWEYACRAGTTTEFAFGDSLSSDQANFDGNHPYGGAPKSVYREKTTTVGSFEPNAFGLYDMHGNVWEWCEDVWHDNYKGAPIDGSAWLSGADSSPRVLRGGSFYLYGNDCRSAYRIRYVPGIHNYTFGVRVVVSARTSDA